LTLDVWQETTQRLHFKIYDSASRRYEVPIDIPDSPAYKTVTTDYEVSFTKTPFGLTVRRKSTGAILFDSAVPGAPLIFADQFIQISSAAETGLFYGLGEHRTRLLHNASAQWQQFVMWARDAPPMDNANLYGVHPFYLGLEKSGLTHGVFLLNSNAMEVDIQPLPGITFRTIGGVLDMYVFVGPTPSDVIQQYTAVIGRPQMPPYWSLGFHLCRYNYNSLAKLKEVISRNRKLGIPYEAQWNDIDYMRVHLDWTYDADGPYAGLPDVVQELHNHSQKYVIIVDPGISNAFPDRYPPYDSGLKNGVFILNSTGDPLIGKVWPGTVVFPDFTNPKTTDWWYEQAKAFHDQLPYDGLWIDMNEPSNFVTGSMSGCTSNNLDNPPFVPNVRDGLLHSNTICPSAHQYLGSHYNLHSLYGMTEAKATDSALRRIRGKRSLTLTRSSFPSLGRYAGHWSGDVYSTWDDLSYSVPAILETQFYGIPFVGADICGFQHDTTEELCVRWMQLGAFYPFMRNHNDDTSRDQDPAVWSTAAQQIMKSVVELRYSLIPFMYTQFYYSHVSGSPVIQPLFFVYPNDAQTHGIDQQFLWGSALLISPVLQQGKIEVNAYFPADRWYDIYDGRLAFNSAGQWAMLKAPLEKVNVHVRGGSIITQQHSAVTTALARKSPFSLLVAYDSHMLANGSLYWDDGESLDTIEKGQFNLIQFVATQGRVVSDIVHAGYMPESMLSLNSVRALGVATEPSRVTVNGQTTVFHYHRDTQELDVDSFTVDLLKPLIIRWDYK
jgi:lysosomal alpha-glucosidase